MHLANGTRTRLGSRKKGEQEGSEVGGRVPRVPRNRALRRVQEAARGLVLLLRSVGRRTRRAAATVPHLRAGWGLDGRLAGLEEARAREEGWESEWGKGDAGQPGS